MSITYDDDALKAQLEIDEGRRYVPYKDSVGLQTVGIGHNMVASPLPSEWTFPLTAEQVDQLYAEDIEAVFDALDDHLPWWRKMDDTRQRALANMCFNMGIGTLLEFKNTLAAMQQGRYNAAASGMAASKWAGQVHARADRLEMAMREGDTNAQA